MELPVNVELTVNVDNLLRDYAHYRHISGINTFYFEENKDDATKINIVYNVGGTKYTQTYAKEYIEKLTLGQFNILKAYIQANIKANIEANIKLQKDLKKQLELEEWQLFSRIRRSRKAQRRARNSQRKVQRRARKKMTF